MVRLKKKSIKLIDSFKSLSFFLSIKSCFSCWLDCYFYQRSTPTSVGVLFESESSGLTGGDDDEQFKWGQERAFSYETQIACKQFALSRSLAFLTHEHRSKLKSIVEVEINAKIEAKAKVKPVCWLENRTLLNKEANLARLEWTLAMRNSDLQQHCIQI